MTRFLSALRRFWYPFTVQAEVVRFLSGRGEVADAPCTCAACAQLDSDEAFGVDPIDIAIWEHELTLEDQ